MVTDKGGIDDKSFNASAWKGMQAAKADAATNVQTKNVASSAEADYEPNLTSYVNQECDFILAVGGLMGDATEKIAAANPNQQFAIVDDKAPQTNVYPMQFDTAQAGFLAGYLAAGYSKTGKVGTYGGMKIPPVTIFMDGFADGVAHYNKAKGKNVQVLGWDKAKQDGLFADDFVYAGRGQAAQRHAGRPGRRRDHAGRRWHRPRHHEAAAGGKFAYLGRRRRLREHRSTAPSS